MIPADLRIGYLPFERLDAHIYKKKIGAEVEIINSTSTPTSVVTISDEEEGTTPFIWDILKAQEIDDNLYSISSVFDGVKEGIYAIVPLNVNSMIILPEAPEEETPVEVIEEETVILPAPDTDADKLTDREELVYGTSPAIADSDLDGYDDGSEVLSLYSPARGSGVLLQTDSQFAQYENSDFHYSTLYPKGFTPLPLVTDSSKDIIFTTDRNESILVSVQENKDNLDVKAWIESLAVVADTSLIFEFKTKGGLQAAGLMNKTAYYLRSKNSSFIYVFSYTAQEEYTYLTTLRMMVESLAEVEE